MKKKFLALLTSLALVSSLVIGCGKQENTDGATDAASQEESVQETAESEKASIELTGTLDFGWAVDHISDEDFGEMAQILDDEAIEDLPGDSRFQRVYGDLSMEVSVWDLLSVGEGNKDYNDYGTVIVTGSGKTKTVFPEVRHGRCPAVNADFDENTMWLVGEAISENGVYAEIPYLFTIDSAGAELIYAVDPVLVQNKLLEMLSVESDDSTISFNYDGDKLYSIDNPGNVTNICLGDHISYYLNSGNDLMVKVTPGIKVSGNDDISYDNMPTFIATVVPSMGSEGVYDDFELKALSALSYNKVDLDNPTALDDAISSAIFKSNAGVYYEGELAAEGHILMSSEEEGPQVKAYVLSMYGEYEFQNGNFVKCAGSGAIPTVITFVLNDSKEYTIVSYEEAEDGSDFVPSIKKMFPEDLWARCISIEEDDMSELEKMERGYAEEYVESIGRENAEIGDYADFEYTYDDAYNVSEKAANAMLEAQSTDPLVGKCPMWYANREVVEEGIRYLYKKEYDEAAKKVIFSKVEQESGKVVESAEYDA